MVDFDLEQMTDDELYALIEDAQTELGKRQTRDVFDDELNELLSRGVAAGLIEDKGHGEAWSQPQGSHDVYLKGAVIEHRDRVWRSNIPNNVTEPGNPDDPQAYRWWTDITDERIEEEPEDDETPDDESDPTTIPEWSGEGIDYEVGGVVMYEGSPYRARQAHTSQPGWSPTAAPALWEKGTLQD